MDRRDPIREQLEDVVAVMSPAARAVFDGETPRDGAGEQEFSDDFDALTPADQASVREAAELRKQLAHPEEAATAHGAEARARKRRRLWGASVLYSLGCLIAVGAMLVDVYTAPAEPEPADTVLTTPEDITRYEAANPLPRTPGAEAIAIPTGVFVTLVELTGPYTVQIGGQFWQRYADDLPKGLTQGIYIPNAKDQPTVKEVYRERQGNAELIGWTFYVTIREGFDYSTYPLGRYEIRLRMWHPDFERNVYLVPDLQAYTSTDPAALPGVDQHIVLENLDIQQAFFSFRTHAFNTDFGAPLYQEEQVHPELYYNLDVRQHIANPFIARTIVPVITLILLFVMMMVLSKKREHSEKFGINPGAVLMTAAGLLLALVFAHTTLRGELRSPRLVYLEFLYIITYLVTVGVVLDATLLVGTPNFKLFRTHDNFWFQVLYWPVIMSTIALVTFVMFYT